MERGNCMIYSPQGGDLDDLIFSDEPYSVSDR